MEQLNKVEASGAQIDSMVEGIIGDKTVDIDNYLNSVRKCFLENMEMLDEDLDKIILRIPVHIYYLTTIAQQLEMRKGVAAEHAKYAQNEALMNATGTVSDKTAKAENATAQDRIVNIAYKTASGIVQKKIDGAMTILDSAKKVQQRKLKERQLTNMAGSAVGSF